VAARLRPQRRPPQVGGRRTGGPVLRVSYGTFDDIQASSPPDAEDPADALGQVRHVADAMNLAAEAIERIQQHVLRITAFAQSAADLAPEGKAEPSTWRTDVAAEVRSIDQIADSTESDACTLLDGTWAVTLADAMGKGVRVLRIAEMSSRVLGSDGIGGHLASLANEDGGGEVTAVRVKDVARCALLQAASAREQITSFLHDAVEPLASTLAVTIANRTAADLAVGDLEFAHQASQLTPLDALAQACPGGFSAKCSKTFSINPHEADASPPEASSDNNPPR